MHGILGGLANAAAVALIVSSRSRPDVSSSRGRDAVDLFRQKGWSDYYEAKASASENEITKLKDLVATQAALVASLEAEVSELIRGYSE